MYTTQWPVQHLIRPKKVKSFMNVQKDDKKGFSKVSTSQTEIQEPYL